jgi:hypothetical protein
MGKNSKPRPPLFPEPQDPLWKGPVLEPNGPFFLNDAPPDKDGCCHQSRPSGNNKKSQG